MRAGHTRSQNVNLPPFLIIRYFRHDVFSMSDIFIWFSGYLDLWFPVLIPLKKPDSTHRFPLLLLQRLPGGSQSVLIICGGWGILIKKKCVLSSRNIEDTKKL